MTTDADHVAVIGADLAGLGAALHLTRAGVPVRLYEASERVGGQAVTDRVDGYLLDRGFQVHNTAYPEPRRLLDESALRFGAFVRGASSSSPAAGTCWPIRARSRWRSDRC